MTIRFKHIVPGAVMALSLGMASCDVLDVTPIDPGTVMKVDANGLMNKCYANMAIAGQQGPDDDDCDVDGLDGGTTGFVRQLWNANELPTDEAMCCWGDDGISSFNFNQYTSSHPMLQGFYYRLYTGIDYCNHYLEKCADYDATMTAEARFLRAMYYYHLMDCFGNVPFTEVISSDCPKQIKRAELFKYIEKELLEIEPNLLEAEARTSSDKNYGRADKSAAWLLLARLYLNAEVYTGTAQWAKAKEYAEKVINSKHVLWTTGANGFSAYQMLFMGDNGESGASCEAILPVLQDGVTTTSYGTTMFLMASCWKADMNTYGNYNTTEFWSGNRARKNLVDKFFPTSDAPNVETEVMTTEAGDDRALFYGKDRTLSITDPAEFTSGFSVAKYRNTYSTGGSAHATKFVDTDYFLMRSAEAYLIAAEADARTNGGTTSETGAKYINALRTRAHASTKASYSLQDILDERSRELYFEGFRRTDLVRYGQFAGMSDYKWEWKGGVQGGVNIDSHLNIFAIPYADMNANPNLVQNPGY